MPILLLFLGLLVPQMSWAYPEFIGYKYSSCLTCHFNGHGNGPLNDYGRALWSAEIAGRLWSGGRTDEQLGEASGFLGSKQLPWWIRPGVKARYLSLQQSPGGSKATTTPILMQANVNTALFVKQDQSLGLILSMDYIPNPIGGVPAGTTAKNYISREHYIRWQATKSLWVYAGMLDKVYGIRIINHTAFSRSKVGLAQNDQAHSVILQYIEPTWELSFDAFMGNMFQDADLRQKGASTLLDYEIRPEWRVGVSAMYSANDYVKNQRLGFHSRTGFGYGSSLLLEAGLIDNVPTSSVDANHGYYLYSEAMQRLVRGYHFFVVGQAYKDAMKDGHPDQVRAGLGLLMFPMARFEFRIEAETGRQLSTQEITPDTWALMSQLHISL